MLGIRNVFTIYKTNRSRIGEILYEGKILLPRTPKEALATLAFFK
jgi:hypothetical protein